MGNVECLKNDNDASYMDDYAIMRYPNRVVLRTMFSLKDDNSSVLKIHRDAGLERTKVIALNSERIYGLTTKSKRLGTLKY